MHVTGLSHTLARLLDTKDDDRWTNRNTTSTSDLQTVKQKTRPHRLHSGELAKDVH